MLALPVPLRQSELMPQVINVRHLPGFKERQPSIPPGAIYIGRANARYRLPASKWANPFMVKREADRQTASSLGYLLPDGLARHRTRATV